MVFFYPSHDATFMLEFYEENEDFESLKLATCQLIYAYKKKKDPLVEKIPTENLLSYYIHVSQELIYDSPNLHFLIPK